MPLVAFRAGEDDRELVLDISDVITDDPLMRLFGLGINAASVQKALADNADADQVIVLMNSPGGSVFEGTSIYNYLRLDSRDVRVHVVGVAASIASVIAMAGDEVVIEPGAMFMIHNPRVGIFDGEARDLRRGARYLDKVAQAMIEAYETKIGGGNREAIRSAMNAETWFTGQEAVDFGLADRTGAAEPELQPTAQHDPEWHARRGAILATFDHLPEVVQHETELGWSGPPAPVLLRAVASARRDRSTVLQALSAARGPKPPPRASALRGGPPKDRPMDPNTLAALGLEPDASPEEIAKAIQAMKRQNDATAEALALARADAAAREAEAKAEAAAAKLQAFSGKVDALVKSVVPAAREEIAAMCWLELEDERRPNERGLQSAEALVAKNRALQVSSFTGPTTPASSPTTPTAEGRNPLARVIYEVGGTGHTIDLTALTGKTVGDFDKLRTELKARDEAGREFSREE